MLLLFLVIAVVVLAIVYSRANQDSTRQREEISKLTIERDGLQQQVNSYKKAEQSVANLKKTEEETKQKIFELRKEIRDLTNHLKHLNADVTAQIIDISDYENITSEECKNELAMLKNEYNELVKRDNAVNVQEVFDGNKKQVTNNKRQILLCFNAECANIINSLTYKNSDTCRGKIQRAFENINKVFAVDGVSLKPAVLEIKLKELTLIHAYEVKKEQEREEQKAIREQMLEEEKVRREIEREKAKLDKEENQFKNEISKLMKYLQKATDVEKQLYVDKIKELEDKLKLLEKDRENVLQREQNTRAGYVYVISNIGSFGEDVYKIGMTRRLEPMDRIKELGDASVPFGFDVHAMIFSEDAPSLENILHQTFKKYQINKVNDRKEFFKVPLNEIEDVVKKNHNATVKFTMIAEATQYRESLKLANT